MVLAPWTGRRDSHRFGAVLSRSPERPVVLVGCLLCGPGYGYWSWALHAAQRPSEFLERSPQDYATKAEARAACSLAVAAALLRGDYEAT